MPGPDFPDAPPPPEVPEEFAAAYREAYRRALEGPPAGLAELPAHEPAHDAVPTPAARSGGRVGPAPGWLARWRGERWFLPAVWILGALLLVLLAYVVGAALSGGSASTNGSGDGRTQLAGSAGNGSGDVWHGPVTGVRVHAITAGCTDPPGRDSAGHVVRYVPANAIDGEPTTAWRCPGTAVGQKLVLRLGGDVEVAQVGLVPGYAKTDPTSGVDRYAENNRITLVRWTLGDGTHVVQRLDPDPSWRAVQVLRVPPTTTDTVTLEVLAVDRGSRNATAISTLRVWAAG